jgi:N6-adenosine-specific RNA methylase IME4
LEEGDRLAADDIFDIHNEWLYWLFDPRLHGDPLAFVLSKNLSRRHLSESQRAIVAGRLANMRRGERTDVGPSANSQKMSTAAAAMALNVSKRSATRGRKVVQFALPEVTEAVERGRIKVSVAEQIAAQSPERQLEIIGSLPRDAEGRLTPQIKKALQPMIREIRKEKIAAKFANGKKDRPDRNAEMLPDKKFGVAIDDFEFEWDHEPSWEEAGTERQPAMHRDSPDDARWPEEIVARCAERFACLADDCVLFRWTTIPDLDVALQVLKLQGFRYVTCLVWNKLRPDDVRGLGHWFIDEQEIVLVGVRGRVDAPSTAHFRSSFSSQVDSPGKRPDDLHEIIEFHWPDTPKLEFNARRVRPGWATWDLRCPA